MPQPTPSLSPDLAGTVTRLLLEFEAVNRKRQLVDELMEMGVTSENYREWCQLRAVANVGVNEGLVVDVTNLLRSIEKGTTPRVDELRQLAQSHIEKAVNRTKIAKQSAAAD